MKSDFRTLQDEVKAIMEDSMDARHCDLTAWLQTMNRFHYSSWLQITGWIIGGAKGKSPAHYPTFESVRRARQKINARGICLPVDGKVARSRRRRESEFREFAREPLTTA